MLLHDKFGRRISDLRISITDRCNYRCVYCRSGNDGPQFPEMPIADYLRIARIFVELGITKVRLTGGEPLLRKGIVEMVGELHRMRTVEGQPLDIAITTNGHLLAEMAQPLADAGLSRVTVSMDAVDAGEFARITRVPNGYDRVLAGIRAAQTRRAQSRKGQLCAPARLQRRSDHRLRTLRARGRRRRPLHRIHATGRRPRLVAGNCSYTRRDCATHGRVHAAARSRARAQRDRAPLRLRRRHRRDRHHRSGVASLLRTLQPGAPHLRRQDSHLPVFSPRARPGRPDVQRAPATKRWSSSSSAPSITRKSATTSASRDLFRRPGRWCILVGKQHSALSSRHSVSGESHRSSILPNAHFLIPATGRDLAEC